MFIDFVIIFLRDASGIHTISAQTEEAGLLYDGIIRKPPID